MTMAQGASVRALASRINASVVREGLSLETVLRQSETPSPRDASLLRALCFGSLRWHHRLQWQASQLLTKPLKRGDGELAALIRMGLYQLQWLRVPDHAAVAASVGAAERLGRASAKGLVNAVLRRFLREGQELNRRMAGVSEAVTSHPGWMLERLKTEWPAKWREIVASNNGPPPMWLRVNARRTTTGQYLATLSEAGIAGQSAEEPASAVLLRGAELQYVDSLSGGGFRFENPNKPRLLADPLAVRVQQILDDEINPGVAAHGGRVALMNVEDGRVFIRFGGGCQGCGQADLTLKEGVVATLTRQIPEIAEVIDTTDHASGENPYY